MHLKGSISKITQNKVGLLVHNQESHAMDFIHSREISALLYETDGLDGGISLRMHKDDLSEARGASRAQKDWNEHVSPVQGYRGGLGEPYSFY